MKLDSVYFKEFLPDHFSLSGKLSSLTEDDLEQINYFKKVVIVKDKSETDEFRMDTIHYFTNNSSAQLAEWFEIICPEKITPKFVSTVENALNSLGFLEEHECIGKACLPLKFALWEYQKKYELEPRPGQLDLETVIHLEEQF